MKKKLTQIKFWKRIINVFIDILFTSDKLSFIIRTMASGQRKYGDNNRKQV